MLSVHQGTTVELYIIYMYCLSLLILTEINNFYDSELPLNSVTVRLFYLILALQVLVLCSILIILSIPLSSDSFCTWAHC